MNSYAALVLAHARLFLREPLALFFTIVFPALMFGLFGSAFGNTPFPGSDVGYVDLQIPALAGMIVGTLGLNFVPTRTATNREMSILRRFKATPMPSWKWMVSEITASVAVALASMSFLVVVGRLGFNAHLPGNWGSVLAAFLLSTLSFLGVGYLVASLAPSPRVAAAAGQLLFLPMFMLSGAAMPLQIFPEGLQSFARVLPMTHVVALMQAVWNGVTGRCCPWGSCWG